MDDEQDIGTPPPYEDNCPVVQQPLQLEFPVGLSSDQQPVQQVPAGYPSVYYFNQPQHQQQQPMSQTSAVMIPLEVTTLSRPRNYVALTIFATFFCCFPFGLIAIGFASQVNRAWARGNYADAKVFSKLAGGWSLAAIITGSCLYAFPVILLIILNA